MIAQDKGGRKKTKLKTKKRKIKMVATFLSLEEKNVVASGRGRRDQREKHMTARWPLNSGA